MPGSEKQQPRAVPIKGAAWGCFCLCGKYKKGTKLSQKLLIPRPQISCPRPSGYHTSVGSGQCFAAGYKCCCGACSGSTTAYFPNLVFKTVHIKGKIQFLRWLAVQFQRHMFGVLEVRQGNAALGAHNAGHAGKALARWFAPIPPCSRWGRQAAVCCIHRCRILSGAALLFARSGAAGR